MYVGISLPVSAKIPARVLIGIALNLDPNSGIIHTLTVLNLPVLDHSISHLFRYSSICFINIVLLLAFIQIMHVFCLIYTVFYFFFFFLVLL